MLVLSRKKDEEIVIDGNIIVTVVDIKQGKVRLGVSAPAHIPVHRREVQTRVDATKVSVGESDGVNT